MIKRIFSQYSFRYPRSITYMLQASEYKLPDYFKWFWRVKDFREVETRKRLVKTQKSVLIFCVAWLFFVLFFWFPIISGYLIVIPLIFLELCVQKPIEFFIIRRAKNKLVKHKAVKIAVAGSFGKTTMREILKTVLREGKKVAAPPHNHNTLLGISNFVKTLDGDEEILIFELGEYRKGDIKKMCELVNPEMGVITGVNEAHLEKFKSLDATTDTIFELANWVARNPLYVNGESKLAKENASKTHIIYTRNGVLNWKVENPRTDLTGTSFALSNSSEKFEFKSKLLGLHQIGPLVAAVDIAFRLGMSTEQIQAGVSNTKSFNHRLEPKIYASGVTMLDDSYNGNPDGVKAVIDFLASLQGYRRFYVTPGLVEMGNRTEVVHKEIGKNLAQTGIEKIVLIKNSVTPYIEKGLKDFNYKGDIIWFKDGLSALDALPHMTAEGDVILLQNDWPDQYY